MSLTLTSPAVSASPNSPSGEHVSPSMSADFEQWSLSVVVQTIETPALYAPPQKRRRTLPSSGISGVCVEHRREPQGSRHSSLSDSVDSISTRSSDCDSLADLDDVAVPPALPSSHISLDDFTLDGEALQDYELVPGVTHEEAELDALLRALSPVVPDIPVALPPLSTSVALPPSSDSCANSMLTQSTAQPQNSGSQVVSLSSPEQRISAFYDMPEDVVMNEMSEFAQPLPSPLQFSAAGSEVTSPEQAAVVDTVDPRALDEVILPRLTITAQPGPKSFLKTSAEPPVYNVAVQSAQPFSVVSHVRVLCADWVKLPSMDAELNREHQASISIHFPNGTPALRPIRVSFEVDVQTPGGLRTIQSEQSQPITLRTNISQFMKAERVVLMDNIFSDAKTEFERWDPVVSNGFQQHFNAWAVTRGFAGSDLDLLHGKLQAQPFIRREAVEDLFERWYGPMVKQFTDKNFRKLWQLRIIYGFITRENASSTLRDVARQVGPSFSGIAITAFMDDSPFLTIASLTPDGDTDFRRLSNNELKQPFRDIIAEMANVDYLTLCDENDTFRLHAKKDVITMLLPKKLHQHLA